MSVPPWITIEGINGVGKTHLGALLAGQLGADCLHLTELTDQRSDQLPGRVIAAMAAGPETFLRTGHPLTESLVLIALKVREYEHVQRASLTARLVLEDRGIDTVALYQAAILTEANTPVQQAMRIADVVYRTAEYWPPAPQRTLLLTDDLDACMRRYSTRIGQPVSPADRALVARIETLYRARADVEPERFIVINRYGRDEVDVLAEMEHHCRAIPREQPCTR